jgi:hypothetical protein
MELRGLPKLRRIIIALGVNVRMMINASVEAGPPNVTPVISE